MDEQAILCDIESSIIASRYAASYADDYVNASMFRRSVGRSLNVSIGPAVDLGLEDSQSLRREDLAHSAHTSGGSDTETGKQRMVWFQAPESQRRTLETPDPSSHTASRTMPPATETSHPPTENGGFPLADQDASVAAVSLERLEEEAASASAILAMKYVDERISGRLFQNETFYKSCFLRNDSAAENDTTYNHIKNDLAAPSSRINPSLISVNDLVSRDSVISFPQLTLSL